MGERIPNVFSREDLNYIKNHPDYIRGTESLLNSKVSTIGMFSVPLRESIRTTIRQKFQGINDERLERVKILAIWIYKEGLGKRLDKDIQNGDYKKTFIIHLNDSPGEFLVGKTKYPIIENTGYIFDRKYIHGEENTSGKPCIFIGINEYYQEVG
jgi:hypothetical protein